MTDVRQPTLLKYIGVYILSVIALNIAAFTFAFIFIFTITNLNFPIFDPTLFGDWLFFFITLSIVCVYSQIYIYSLFKDIKICRVMPYFYIVTLIGAFTASFDIRESVTQFGISDEISFILIFNYIFYVMIFRFYFKNKPQWD